MVDWARHFNAIYTRLGVKAVLTVPGTDGGDFALKVLDKTAGIAVGDGVQVTTIRPACDMRAREFFVMHELTREALKGASISFNGKAWGIMNHEMRPAPTGEQQGEIRLFLSERDD